MRVVNYWENKGKAWGLEIQVDLTNCDADTIRDKELIENFVIELCDLIKMKRFGPCTVVHFGEDERVAGFSVTQLIETSLISGHFANQTNAAYINVFSCKEFDPKIVEDFCAAYFKAKDVTSLVNYRL